MSRSLIKRIEFCKIKDFASNIKIMLRSTSHSASVQQRAMTVEQNSENSANSINSAYEIANAYKEHPPQQRSMTDGNQTKSSTTLRTRLADKNSANSVNSANLGNKELDRRHHSLHMGRSKSKVDQRDFMPTNNLNEDQTIARPYREGPCKRTLSNQREIKFMPSTNLRIEDDKMPKSERLNSEKTVRFGRRERQQHRLILQNDNEKLGLQQSISLLDTDKNSTNLIYRASQLQRKPKSLQPRAIFDDQNFPDKTYKIISGRREQKPFEQLKQEEIKEAKYGETLTKIAEKNFNDSSSCHLSPENTFRFSIKNHLQITTPTLRAKAAEKERKLSERNSIKKKPIIQKILKPTIRFGRRDSDSKAQHFNQLKETNILKSKDYDSEHESNIYRHILRDESAEFEPPTPRFDEIFYRESPKLEKSYAQTWAEFPTERSRVAENRLKYSPPPFIKRPKNERPTTAKPWGDVDE